MSEKLSIALLEDLAPAAVHRSIWQQTGLAAGWEYGHASGPDGGVPFWFMDLTRNPAAGALWEHAKTRCEATVGQRLRVLRQYANGHTYGQGGRLHQDDHVPDTHTLLYYPMPAWQGDWDGETVFENGAGEVVAAIRPAPNRGVLFDSRIPHLGRAPSRACVELRVTVAYKLRVVHEEHPSNAPGVDT